MQSPVPALPARLRTRAGGCLLLLGGLLACSTTLAGLPGPDAAELEAGYWIARAPSAQAVLMDAQAVAAHNARMRQAGVGITDLAALPGQLAGHALRQRIQELSRPPARPLYDRSGRPLAATTLADLHAALDLAGIADTVTPRWGLVVRRGALRTFPTAQAAYSAADQTDLDRFQESALFPGDGVAVLHASADGRWLFVASERYWAWIQAEAVALGSRDQVLDYTRRSPALTVTGAHVRTAHTPQQPELSGLVLDMGVRLPLHRPLPPQVNVHGQSPLGSHVLELPQRRADGQVQLVPALLPRSADVSPAPLPLTRAGLVGQAFKFLGERYGWGHDYGARDCSGLVSEIYRSFGLLLPRNTGDQARTPALQSLPLPAAADAGARRQALAQLQVGDLVFMPGHVMLVVGQQANGPWVIHDIHGGAWRDADGILQRTRLNGVVVTPLAALLGEDGTPFIDQLTALRRVAAPAVESSP
jgi:cell wall-associated NlpC family hydrolase